MVVKHIQRRLQEKSEKHSMDLQKLGKLVTDEPLSPNVFLMEGTPQFLGMNTILEDVHTEQVDFVFYFDRLAALMIEKYDLTLPHQYSIGGFSEPLTISPAGYLHIRLLDVYVLTLGILGHLIQHLLYLLQ
jgi:hypothetical protein